MHETSWPKSGRKQRLATNRRVENCVCVLAKRLVALIATSQSSVKWCPCFPVCDARRTGRPRGTFDWSEHFSPDVPAASTWGPQASSSLSFKPRIHSALINEDEAAGRGVQELRWQSPAWWGNTAGQRYGEWESIQWAKGEEGSYKWFLLWAKYSIRRSDKVLRLLATFVFSGSAQCLPSSYRKRSGIRWEKWSGSRSERLLSSFPSINSTKWDVKNEFVFCTTAGLII